MTEKIRRKNAEAALEAIGDLLLHETVIVNIADGNTEQWHITRVYNGWIYRYRHVNQPNSGHSVFVPMDEDWINGDD